MPREAPPGLIPQPQGGSSKLVKEIDANKRELSFPTGPAPRGSSLLTPYYTPVQNVFSRTPLDALLKPPGSPSLPSMLNHFRPRVMGTYVVTASNTQA